MMIHWFCISLISLLVLSSSQNEAVFAYSHNLKTTDASSYSSSFLRSSTVFDKASDDETKHYKYFNQFQKQKQQQRRQQGKYDDAGSISIHDNLTHNGSIRDNDVENAIRVIQGNGLIVCQKMEYIDGNNYNKNRLVDDIDASVLPSTIHCYSISTKSNDEANSHSNANSFTMIPYTISDVTDTILNDPKPSRPKQQRGLQVLASDSDTASIKHDAEGEVESWYDVLFYSLGAVACVFVAALAAGLTLGMLGLDPLMLLIKERAAIDPKEREMAKRLLPIIKQRHLLLVTLLLMNSIANETMPIFLEKLFPPAVAIAISVTLVLFFGEIIPSAIFTGPNQLRIASAMVPIVRVIICLLYPLAGPIAKLLDRMLGGGGGGTHNDGDTNQSIRKINQDDNHGNGGGEGSSNGHEEFNLYDRNELAALVRIQYEERLAMKRRITNERRNVCESFCSTSTPPQLLNPEIFSHADVSLLRHQGINIVESPAPIAKAIVDQASVPSSEALTLPFGQTNATTTTATSPAIFTSHSNNPDHRSSVQNQITSGAISNLMHHNNNDWSKTYQKISDAIELNRNSHRDSTIELDEVMMVEGALQMKTKCAFDVFTPIRNVYTLPASMVLTEKNMVNIYASGYSRIPIYDDSEIQTGPGKKRRYPQSAIIGILVTKVLIVVDPKDRRTVGSLPLRIPQCVSPATPLVDLINMFQTGGAKGGHQALVCAIPSIGNKAFQVEGQCLPERAGLIGIVTMEDVLEMLLQEEIYDEMDHEQRAGHRLAEMVWRRWKVFTAKRRNDRSSSNRLIFGNRKADNQNDHKDESPNERTSLLSENK